MLAHFAAQGGRRLQSGSSIRNSRGLRTIARAIATAGAGRRRASPVCSRAAPQLQHLRHFIHSRLPAAFLFLAHLHAEGDVVAHRQMRKQGIVLEDHRGGCDRAGVVAVMFSSCSQIWPSLTGSSPASRRSRVLFPQPDGPTSTIRLRGYPATGALSAGLPSKRLLMFCRLSMACALPLGN